MALGSVAWTFNTMTIMFVYPAKVSVSHWMLMPCTSWCATSGSTGRLNSFTAHCWPVLKSLRSQSSRQRPQRRLLNPCSGTCTAFAAGVAGCATHLQSHVSASPPRPSRLCAWCDAPLDEPGVLNCSGAQVCSPADPLTPCQQGGVLPRINSTVSSCSRVAHTEASVHAAEHLTFGHHFALQVTIRATGGGGVEKES